jgi:hypothetical protein
MLAPRTRDSGEDHCYCPLGFLESFIPLIVIVLLLMVFFPISFIVFSHVSFDEEATISGHVTTTRVPYVGHVFKILKLPCFGKLLGFVCYGHGVVGSALSSLLLVALMVSAVRVVLVVLIWKSLLGFFFRSDHLRHCALEFFIASRVLFAEIIELPLSQDPIGESLNDLSFSDVMYLSTQFTKIFLLESFLFCLSDRVCDDAYKIFTKKLSANPPNP